MNAQAEVLSPFAAAPAARDHFVQFYERDEALVAEVASYLRNGLVAGSAAIAIMTPAHEAQVRALWAREGFDPAAAEESGQLATLDAQATLARVMLGGRPDPARFEAVIGSLVRQAIARHGQLVAFGEMVALLFARGEQTAAVQLEDLWNRLGQARRFSIFCAYPMRDMADTQAAEAFRHVCAAHSHVVPGESFRASSESEQVRFIVELQQQAASLARELARRKSLQEQLAEREREIADFVENGAMALHRVGPDGCILWANRAELDMLGYTAEEYVGMNIREVHADTRLATDILGRLARGESLRDQSAVLRCKDGSERHVLVTSNALLRDGRLVHTRCFTRDVTDRWLAQEALRERSAILHLAMQGARAGHWIADPDRRTLRCSSELAALLGLDGAGEWGWDEFALHVHPDERTAFLAALGQAPSAQGRLAVEARLGAGHDWRWYEVRGDAVYDDAGHASRIYGLCMDITDRKRSQHLLAHYREVVESAHDAIVSKTLDGTVVSWNRAAEELFGYTAEEIVGRPITLVIPPDLVAEEAFIIAKMQAGERIDHFATRRLAKDGTQRRVSLSISPIHDAGGRVIGASKIARALAT